MASWMDTPEEARLRRALRDEAAQVMPSADALTRIRACVARPSWRQRVWALISRKPSTPVRVEGQPTDNP